MAFFEVRVTVNRLVPVDELHPDDRDDVLRLASDHWFEIECQDALEAHELGLASFYAIFCFAKPEQHHVSVRAWRQAA